MPTIPKAQNSALLFGSAGGTVSPLGSGRSVAWLARLFRVQEVVSSNLTAPTIFLNLARMKLPPVRKTKATSNPAQIARRIRPVPAARP